MLYCQLVQQKNDCDAIFMKSALIKHTQHPCAIKKSVNKKKAVINNCYFGRKDKNLSGISVFLWKSQQIYNHFFKCPTFYEFIALVSSGETSMIFIISNIKKKKNVFFKAKSEGNGR